MTITIIFGAVALAAIAVAVYNNMAAHSHRNNALLIQADRDRMRAALEREQYVNAKVEEERERLAAEVGDMKAKLKRTAVTRDPKTGRMVSTKI
jgi:septal ring factor EnvC (AmiA/AmiB activator)